MAVRSFLKPDPRAIHGFLHSQFDGLSKICEVRRAGENIGYLEGCSTVLLVITTFANVGDDELSLLGVEELESDFETVPEKKEKRKRDVKVDSLGYESEKEKKMKYKKQEQELLKKIRSKIKNERRGMEARLKSYIKSEVEGLKTFCESLFLKFQAGLKPTPTPSPLPHSPPSPHSPIMTSLKALQEDALHEFPEGFIDWPVVDVRKSPQQSNSYDCGVFVIKYMEVVTSLEVVTWQDHQGWQADMPRFRAESPLKFAKPLQGILPTRWMHGARTWPKKEKELRVAREQGAASGEWRVVEQQNMTAKKFGGGRLLTGTPSLPWSCAVVIASLLAGASVVHNIYKPNLVRNR
ncbi:hypothetical protein KSP40_PGU009001 [Platanthera guangdongensis]|uniref:Ubiquitin-like protease family profile domain-containing protein n=1 Tax=Platanthera guangdongensis TaxID=2320717 RepID=A0ABR2MBZ7_9ASPA